MTPVVAVIAPGAMGAAVGKRLADNGLKVLTSLKGRSAETQARAKAAGMVDASDEEIAASDFILSILPPGDALSLGASISCRRSRRAMPSRSMSIATPSIRRRWNGWRRRSRRPAVRSPIPALSASRRSPAMPVRASIPPALPRNASPLCAITASTSACSSGAMSAASALKMSYAGITKGTQAIGAAMMLAATRAGNADDLFAELQGSQKEMLAWFKRSLSMMPPKAYRWIAEMHEIAGFVGDDPAAHELYQGAAHFYERFADDFDGDKLDTGALAAFLEKKPN